MEPSPNLIEMQSVLKTNIFSKINTLMKFLRSSFSNFHMPLWQEFYHRTINAWNNSQKLLKISLRHLPRSKKFCQMPFLQSIEMNC